MATEWRVGAGYDCAAALGFRFFLMFEQCADPGEKQNPAKEHKQVCAEELEHDGPDLCAECAMRQAVEKMAGQRYAKEREKNDRKKPAPVVHDVKRAEPAETPGADCRGCAERNEKCRNDDPAQEPLDTRKPER